MLQKEWQGIIRSLKTSDDDRYLVIELLSEEFGYPVYHILDLDRMELVCENLKIKTSENLVLKYICPGVLVLNEYDQNQNPDVSKVIAFDFNSREVLWEKEMKILGIEGEYLSIAHPHFENRISFISVRNGSTVEFESSETNDETKSQSFPVVYMNGNKYYEYFDKFIHSATDEKIEHSCEYLETSSKMFISYYVSENNKLTNKLLIIDKSGTVLEKLVLGQNLEGIGKDTFFIQNSYLIFVSNKSTLNIHEI